MVVVVEDQKTKWWSKKALIGKGSYVHEVEKKQTMARKKGVASFAGALTHKQNVINEHTFGNERWTAGWTFFGDVKKNLKIKN